MRKRGHRRPRPLRRPVLHSTWQSIAVGLHTAMAAMRTNPCTDVYDTLAGAFSAIAITIRHDRKFSAESVVINAGAMALLDATEAILVGAPLRDEELVRLQEAVNTIDQMLPRLDFGQLVAAEIEAVALAKAERVHHNRGERT